MPPHDLPLALVQRARLEQDRIGNAHFAIIVQQRTAANMFQLGFADAQDPRQVNRQLNHVARMSFRLMIAQFEGMYPTWYGTPFCLKAPNTWGVPDDVAETTFTSQRKVTYWVEIQA